MAQVQVQQLLLQVPRQPAARQCLLRAEEPAALVLLAAEALLLGLSLLACLQRLAVLRVVMMAPSALLGARAARLRSHKAQRPGCILEPAVAGSAVSQLSERVRWHLRLAQRRAAARGPQAEVAAALATAE